MYTANGTVGTESVTTQGDFRSHVSSPGFQDNLSPFIECKTFFSVNTEGLVNVTNQTTEIFTSYSINVFDGITNLLNSSHPYSSLMVDTQGQDFAVRLSERLQPFAELYEEYLKSL